MLTAAEIMEWEDGAPVRATPLLEVAGLVKHFDIRGGWLQRRSGSVRAVDDVSFSVAERETLAIIGEQGCGKTTVARLIMQLARPDRGTVRFDGKPVAASRAAFKAFRSQVQMVFADSRATLNPRVRVGTQVALSPCGYGMRRSAAAENARTLLDRVGLDRARYAACYPHMLSDDQCRRVDLARALALQPRLLVVDEAAHGRDPAKDTAFDHLLLDLRQELGLTCIILARDPANVGRIASRMVVMHLGRIVETGPANSIVSACRHPYTADLLELSLHSGPQFHQELVAQRVGSNNVITPPPGCRYHQRCRYAEAVCVGTEPPLLIAGAEHRAACHIADPVSGHSRAVQRSRLDHTIFSRA